MNQLEEVLAKIENATPKEREAIEAMLGEDLLKVPWCPNPGSQTDAYNSEADILGYGGEAGPGKSALLIGLALTKHKRSLIIRKTAKEASALADEFETVLGHTKGLNRQEKRWRLDNDRLIDYGGCEHEGQKQKYKGKPHDLIGIDEAPDLSRSAIEFIMQWNRSTTEGQRCRVVMTFNPPTTSSGLWVIEYFAPWLDPRHPNPAEYGELRWFTTIDGKDTEVDGRGPHPIDGEMITAKSRTFIRGYLHENTVLYNSGYDATRAAAPSALRDAYRRGDFEAALADFPGQVIPSAWVRAAQERWKRIPPKNVPMSAIGVDCSGGGNDPLVLSRRYDAYFSELIEVPGKELDINRLGSQSAGIVTSYRKDNAIIGVDMGGGYGGSLIEALESNGIKYKAHNGAQKSFARTKDRKAGFANKRSEVIWKFRELLDPDQDFGSPCALPPDDSQLFADLTAPSFVLGSRGVEVESKKDVCAKLGRSTNHGDAVQIAYATGATGWAAVNPEQAGVRGRSTGAPKVNMGHAQVRRRRR